MAKFKKPGFEKGSLELRFESGEVAIYGTKNGLKKLSDLCLNVANLLEHSSTEHIHLEDMEILTPDSLRGVIAGFSKPLGEQKQASS
jgi:hypothetical protein